MIAASCSSTQLQLPHATEPELLLSKKLKISKKLPKPLNYIQTLFNQNSKCKRMFSMVFGITSMVVALRRVLCSDATTLFVHSFSMFSLGELLEMINVLHVQI